MKEYSIGSNEAGQKLHKFISRILKEAPVSFGYKMLRKKNIVLNGKKASGAEVLAEGDRVSFYLSDETFAKFAGGQPPDSVSDRQLPKTDRELPIIYEDEHILLYNKPAGKLSQKASESDFTVNEYLIASLIGSGQLTRQELAVFRPSVCNRLDRNTSGLIICGKSMQGLQVMSRLLKERSLCKHYRCIVLGTVRKSFSMQGYLHKDQRTNKVTVANLPSADATAIHTEAEPLQSWTVRREHREIPLSLLQVHLITGKTHQIRAHLASIGHPVAGDYKYGNREINDLLKKSDHIESQLLHAYSLRFPQLEGTLAGISGKEFVAPLPDTFERMMMDSHAKYAR